MSVDVIMPQMGESIAEGTLVKWLKNVGENVDRDEPLFEISTDKVDAEIPSPSAGVLLEILVQEGQTVEINTVVGRIGQAGEAARPSAPKSAAPPTPAAPRATAAPRPAPTPPPASAPAPAPTPAPKPAPPAAPAYVRSSPVVQKIAAEHGVDVSLVEGTGEGGRVTKKDIMTYIESAATSAPPVTRAQPAAQPQAVPQPSAPKAPAPSKAAVFAAGQEEAREPMSIMRKKIAEHMVLSAHTSPHVYSVYEVNFDRVSKLRDKRKAEYEAAGAKLTYTAFIAKVIVDALRQFPMVNASIDGDNIIYKKDINLGIAVALDNGLIVPVIRNADERNLLGLSRAINDLGARARSKKLSPDEVQSGTFTITNPGIFGALYGLPLINQPQVAILGVGGIEKRPIVIDDAIAIRPVCHLTLGYDHRLIDGADAGRFLSFVKERLEKFEEGWM
jgi:2-oxoglutarate dehydrogenase E2 component (dihydrolipoamide succinyltransferase)